MWGNHLLDMYQHANFNVSFPHDLTRNPSRLIQWQYWWWFWFSSVFVLYYLLLTKVILKRSLKFRPKIVTSYRAHGRWGDIVVAIIPIFWCLNILSHSTLLLRMSEFQTETNIVTIRVRGRQWYWVYKLELSNFFLLSNKKVLVSGDRYTSLVSNFRSGTHDLFLRHQAYRQYWRNWFLQKNVLFYSHKYLVGEMVSPETKYNDVDTNKKLHDFNTKVQRFKPNWYGRFLESNNLSFTQIHNNSTILARRLTDFWVKNLKASYSYSCVSSLNEKKNNFISMYGDSVTLSSKKSNSHSLNYNSSVQLKRFFVNRFVNIKDLTIHTNSYVFPTDNFKYLDILNVSISEALKNEYGDVFKQRILETYRCTVSALVNKKSLSNLFSDSLNWNFSKELSKYTFDLKAKFGYIPTKIELNSPALFNTNLLDNLPIMSIVLDNESEFKNLNTVFKYFLVVDQNRKILNRFNKQPKLDLFIRSDKAESYANYNSPVINVNPIFEKKVVSFDPILAHVDESNFERFEGVNATYWFNNVKSNNIFINQSNAELSADKTHDFDYFSPYKYNNGSEMSSTQSNIRSQKKLLFNQRLLHTTSILVLPTKLNITVITNSYDVIHSWFIPGLGLKMDCVPGRSTHHTLFIDHPGLYYGQCAEICGRFHHHMPIKIAALYWEHFLLWWYHHTSNLGVHAFLKDFNKTSLKEFKTRKVYPVTTKFITQRPVV